MPRRDKPPYGTLVNTVGDVLQAGNQMAHLGG